MRIANFFNKTVSAVILFTCLHTMAYSQAQLELSNKKASKQAKALYRYIQDMYGKKILSGQMVSTGNFDELKYIQDSTGKQPAIRGMDFIDSSKNKDQVKGAKEWWRKGGIPTIMWHWGAPGIGNGYVNSKKEVDIDKCFEEGNFKLVEQQSFFGEFIGAKIYKK